MRGIDARAVYIAHGILTGLVTGVALLAAYLILARINDLLEQVL